MQASAWHAGGRAFFQLSNGARGEGIFVQEEDSQSVICVRSEVIEAEDITEHVLPTASGASCPCKFIRLATRALRTAPAEDWDSDVAGWGTALDRIPTSRQIMSAYDDRALTSGADDAPRTNAPTTRSAVGGSSASTGPTGPETRVIDQERLDRLTAMYEALDGGDLGGRAAAAAAAVTGAEAEAAYLGFGRRGLGLAQDVPMQTPALAHFGRAGQMLAGEAPSRATPAVLGLPPQRAPLQPLEPTAAASPILVQQGDPDKLLQLEMVRFMAEMRSSRRSDPLESYDPRVELGGAATTSAGKAFAAAEAQRSKVYSLPGRIVEEFRRMAMDELGADLGMPWRFRDLHRRVNWGQMKSMQRCFLQDVCVCWT